MAVRCAAVVVTFEAGPGVDVAAIWDGSRWCQVHVVEDGGFGPQIETWDMWDRWTESAAIPCTPEALRELVEYRLSDPDAVRLIRASVEDVSSCFPAVVFNARRPVAFSLN